VDSTVGLVRPMIFDYTNEFEVNQSYNHDYGISTIGLDDSLKRTVDDQSAGKVDCNV
jgi:hypothetical protein